MAPNSSCEARITMDKRAQIPVTLPRDSPTQSYWQDPPDKEIADLRTTEELPARADVVIIGSGISGAAAAWNLLQDDNSPSPSIVMLEARQACSGATGRNGKSLVYPLLMAPRLTASCTKAVIRKQPRIGHFSTMLRPLAPPPL